MKIIAVIPARYASTRFPAKLMQDLVGKTVIQRTYEAAVNTGLFDDVFVVTDSILISNINEAKSTFLSKSFRKIASTFANGSLLMFEIKDTAEIENPNNVKVVTDQNGFALYFSRSVIPYPRDINAGVRYMKHIGIYAFRKQALLDFYRLPMKSLEASEKLEQLRYLEFGKRIKMVETNQGSIGIDTQEDLEKARKLL